MEDIYQSLSNTLIPTKVDTQAELKHLYKHCPFQLINEPVVRLADGEPVLDEYLTFTLYAPQSFTIYTSIPLTSWKSGIHQIYTSIQLQSIPNFHRIRSISEYHHERKSLVPGHMDVQPLSELTLDTFIHKPECNLDTFLQVILQVICALDLAHSKIGFIHGNLTPKHIHLQHRSTETCIVYPSKIHLYTKYVVIISGYEDAVCHTSAKHPSRDIYYLLIICMYVASKVNREVYTLYSILFPDGWDISKRVYHLYIQIEKHMSGIMSGFIYNRYVSQEDIYCVLNGEYQPPAQKFIDRIEKIVSYSRSTVPHLRHHPTFIHEYKVYLRSLLWTLNSVTNIGDDLRYKLKKCYVHLMADAKLVQDVYPEIYYEIRLIHAYLGKYEKQIRG